MRKNILISSLSIIGLIILIFLYLSVNGIRTKQYKLMHFYYDIDEWEMYDLNNDPSEMKNIYNDPKYSEIKETLHIRLSKLKLKYGDSDSLNQMHIKRYLKSKKK